MIYVAGILGFVGGFALSQMILYFFLRNKTKEELLEDRYLKWKYGTLSWAITIFSTYTMIETYRLYFE